MSIPSSTNGDPAEPVHRPEVRAACVSLRRRDALTTASQAGLVLLMFAAAAAAISYVWIRGDDMVGVLLRPDASGNLFEERLTSLVLPPLLFALFVAGCVVLLGRVESRGGEALERGLDAIGRLRRESEVGMARSRNLTHMLEETLANGKRAFLLQLYLSRTLFVVALGLLAIAVIQAIGKGDIDLATLTLGAGSFVALLLTVAIGMPEKVGDHLSDLTQLQLLAGVCTRQIALWEEHAYGALNAQHSVTLAPVSPPDVAVHAAAAAASAAAAADAVTAAEAGIDDAVKRAVERLERFTERSASERRESRGWVMKALGA